ncbi:MAG: M4 family metallopeptidase, partial [Proteobacteria bacterium]|nr:M4 family metallopeptidase [Pseudomonadota bacterium]
MLAIAQPSEVSLPDIQITPLLQSHGIAITNPAPGVDPRIEAFGDRLVFAIGEIRNNQSKLASSRIARQASVAGKAADKSALSDLMSRKSIRLVGHGPGMPITFSSAPDFNAKLSNAGTIRNLTAAPGNVLQKAETGIGEESANQTVMAFFRAQQSVLGLVDPENELRLHTIQTDDMGHSHLRYQQNYKGIPVFGAELIAQLDDQGSLITINGAYFPTPTKLIVQPTVSKEQAIFSVKSKFRLSTNISDPELIIFSKDGRNPRLAWHFEIDLSAIENRLIILDAHDGTELFSINQVQTGQASGQGVDLFGQTQVFSSSLWEDAGIFYLVDTTKTMFDLASVPPSPSTSGGVIVIGDVANSTDPNPTIFLVTSNTGPSGPWLPDGVSAAVNLSATYDYFLQRLGRNSLDGDGGNMIGVVRMGQNLSNAFFNGSTQTMYFGDGEPFAGALDVVAHEMAHGVIGTSVTGGLLYFGQSGALNEGFADIFGEMAEQHFNQASPDWLIGTRLSSPLRNMMDPGALEFAPGRPYPSKMSEFIRPDDPVLNLFTDRDNDGVHINSSIINKAFYLLTSGANGISLQDAEKIFYRALTTKLSSLSEFVDMRFAAIQSAEELFGASSPQSLRTEVAFDSVEIFDSPTNSLPAPFPGIVGPDGTLFVFWDSVVGAYFLGRLDSSLGDTAPGIQLSVNPITPASPSVSGDGSFAVFVNAQQDICLIPTDASSIEICLGFPGEIASVAMAPDGETFGIVFLDALGNPTNLIGVIDIATSQQQLFSLVAPNIDGASSIDVIQADAMDFTSDNRFIIYDAFNAINFNDGSSVGLWSIYAIDRFTNTTITLTAPTPGLHTAFPNIAQTSDGHMTFDVFDISANNNIVVAANVFTGDVAGITSTGPFFSAPAYTGDDTGIVFSLADNTVPTGASLWRATIDADSITPTGVFDLWVTD